MKQYLTLLLFIILLIGCTITTPPTTTTSSTISTNQPNPNPTDPSDDVSSDTNGCVISNLTVNVIGDSATRR